MMVGGKDFAVNEVKDTNGKTVGLNLTAYGLRDFADGIEYIVRNYKDMVLNLDKVIKVGLIYEAAYDLNTVVPVATNPTYMNEAVEELNALTTKKDVLKFTDDYNIVIDKKYQKNINTFKKHIREYLQGGDNN